MAARLRFLIRTALFVPGLVLALGQAREGDAHPPRDGAPLRVSGPHVYENLDVYLIHGSDDLAGRTFLPFAQALAQKKVIVRETGTVSQLTIENLSSEEVFVQAGEIVKGGKQDRVLGSDFILPPRSGKVLVPSYCVERGRWRKRGNEAADRFTSSESNVASKDLKIANHKESQSAVWENVDRFQDRLQANLGTDVRAAQSASSLQLTLEHDRVRQSVEACVQALSGIVATPADVVGYAFAINGEINSAEVYGSRALFLGSWPKLLRAGAVEAVAERKASASHVPPALDSVSAFLAPTESGTVSEKPAGPGAWTLVRETSSRLVVETRISGSRGWVHRSYLRK